MSQKRISLAIVAWLEAQRATLTASQSEELEMGIATIVGAFGINAADAAKNGVSGRTLEEWAASSSSSSSSSSAGGSSGGQASAASASPSAAASSPAAQPASAEQEELAEKLKAEGNKLLLEGSFLRAEDLYSQAIEACPSGKSSHVYFTNRAAARFNLSKYEASMEDAEEAVRLNSKYAKGHVRLGAALQKLGRADEALAAYEAADQLEPANKAALTGIAECKKALAAPAGKQGSSGAGGGVPDLSSLAGPGGMAAAMGNPMVQGLMAKVASDPELARTMQDPEVMSAFQEIMAATAGGNMMAAMPLVMKHMSNPKMGALMGKMMGGMMGGGGGSPFG